MVPFDLCQRKERAMTAGASAEFSRPFRLSQLGPERCEISLRPGPAECRALARRFDLLRLSGFECTACIRPLADAGEFELNGRFTAELQQACVVSLDPVCSSLNDDFRLTFRLVTSADGDATRSDCASREAVASFDPDEDDVEPVVDDEIDLGEIFAQYLYLALDPYPRKPGAALAPGRCMEPPPKARPNPFAILRQFKDGA